MPGPTVEAGWPMTIPFVPPLGTASPDEVRQEIVDSLYRTFKGFDGGFKMFPGFLVEAIEKRVWEAPRKLEMGIIPAISFKEFIYAAYPRGLGATYELVERFIAHDDRALALWTPLRRGQHGGEREGAGRRPKLAVVGDVPGQEIKDDNVTLDCLRKGNSRDQGMRRLQDAARTDSRAADLLAKVQDPADKTTIHGACVQMGWRRPTKTIHDTPDALADATLRKIGPLDTVKRAWRHATPQEREEIAGWFMAAHLFDAKQTAR